MQTRYRLQVGPTDPTEWQPNRGYCILLGISMATVILSSVDG